MKSERAFFEALKAMLKFYEKCKKEGYSEDEAFKKTLETYQDFYKWLFID